MRRGANGGTCSAAVGRSLHWLHASTTRRTSDPARQLLERVSFMYVPPAHPAFTSPRLATACILTGLVFRHSGLHAGADHVRTTFFSRWAAYQRRHGPPYLLARRLFRLLLLWLLHVSNVECWRFHDFRTWGRFSTPCGTRVPDASRNPSSLFPSSRKRDSPENGTSNLWEGGSTPMFSTPRQACMALWHLKHSFTLCWIS